MRKQAVAAGTLRSPTVPDLCERSLTTAGKRGGQREALPSRMESIESPPFVCGATLRQRTRMTRRLRGFHAPSAWLPQSEPRRRGYRHDEVAWFASRERRESSSCRHHGAHCGGQVVATLTAPAEGPDDAAVRSRIAVPSCPCRLRRMPHADRSLYARPESPIGRCSGVVSHVVDGVYRPRRRATAARQRRVQRCGVVRLQLQLRGQRRPQSAHRSAPHRALLHRQRQQPARLARSRSTGSSTRSIRCWNP